MNNLFSAPASYSEEYLDRIKCRPLIDDHHESLIKDIIEQKLVYPDSSIFDSSYSTAGVSPDLISPIFDDFKKEFEQHITSSKLNQITGFDAFARSDICIGCTQFIDNLHLKNNVQVLTGEYRYHKLINPTVQQVEVDTLIPGIPLIISVPFSKIGKVHPRMREILDQCVQKNIDVHIDGAWVSAAKNVNIDLAHPAIRSFAVSMSKGYGLAGWNRIGVRWVKDSVEDSITVMNDYAQVTAYLVVIGKYFLKNVQPDHLWNTHRHNYFKLCDDFKLETTDTIHMATNNNNIIGLAPMLKWMERNV